MLDSDETLTDKQPHEHPELDYDFTNNYLGLQKYVTLRIHSTHLPMSIHGMMKSDSEINLCFDEFIIMTNLQNP